MGANHRRKAGIGLELVKLLTAMAPTWSSPRAAPTACNKWPLTCSRRQRSNRNLPRGSHPVRSSASIYNFTTAKKLEIEFLINNAGFGAFGYAHEIPAEKMLEMIQVNCSAVVHLTRLYVPAMVTRRHGDVMIVASLAAFQPLPFNSVYAATKAFDLLFAEGIAEELRPSGVNVCALCPGSTNTEFQKVADQPDRVFRSAETAEKVARVGLEAMAAGKSYVISGFMNNVMKESQRLAPRSLVSRMAANMMRPDKS